MNMLIIGNGFDLAHGRPTTYGDFLKFVGQISRTRDYHGTKKQFEETMPDLHSEVRKYILSAIDTKVNYRNAVAGNSNPVIQEMYECLDENVWYEYFQVIVREDKIRGKNWIDFESEILEVIKFFDEKFNDLYEPLPAQSKDLGVFNNKISAFWSKLKFSKYNKSKGRTEDYKNTCFDFIEKTYQDLECLIRCLEIYLDDCVAKMQITCYSPDIKELECDSILNFNYTAIPIDIYPLLTNTLNIHGHAKTDRSAGKNDMVLGVNEYWEGPEKNVRTNFNLYKKFVQRIIKGTGINYKTTLNQMSLDYEEGQRFRAKSREYFSARHSNIYIFGHSLDVTDGDVLREVIRTLGVITTIFYRNKQQQANQIANLSKVLGQDELLERTFSISPTIIFKQQADMEKL